MAEKKDSPRELYLTIVYLSIFGLYVLNTPKSLLDSFQKMRVTLDDARSFKNTNVQGLFASFEADKLKKEPERSQPIYERAKKAEVITNNLNNYLENLRSELVVAGGGINPKSNDVKQNGDTDISPRLMISLGKGKALKEKLNAAQQELTALLDVDQQKKVGINLSPISSQKGLVKKNWEQTNFGDGIPLTAALTNIARLQAEVASTQDEIIKNILGSVDKAVVNLDQFSAVAVAPSSYLIQGQPYKAEVFLTAYDSKSNPSILVNGSSVSVSNGKGTYVGNTSTEGVHSWVGTVRVRQTDGSYKEYRTAEQKYQVAKPSAVVSPKKMNVLYVGVPNPIEVSAPGIPKDKIKVSITGGSISGSNGNYSAIVNSPGTVKINVSAEVSPGKTQTLSASEFRVKRIPDPKAKFAGKSGGTLNAAVVRDQDYISVALENFDFDAKFSLQRYNVIVAKPRADAITAVGNGSTLSASVKAALASVTPGSTVIFTDIIAVGPDGVQRSLDPIAIRVN
jgi:gliding motility-associated protein GldM